MTHDQLTNAVNSILGFRGQRIGFPDGRYFNECTAVVAHLHSRLGIPLPPMFPYGPNARADGWGVSFPGELAPFYNHEAYQPGKAYPYGTLLLWNSPHIAIVLSHDGGNIVQVFQQNADPNGAPCDVFNRVINNQFHACNYALIPKLAEPPQAPLWTTEPTNKLVRVKPGSRKWNLAQPDFASVRDNPITVADDNTIFTATAVLHHRQIPQYNYYLEDANTPHGWNVLDCENYVAPAPIPVVVPTPPPAAPIPFTKAEDYTILPEAIVYFGSSRDAVIDQNALGQLDQGTYKVVSRDKNMINLTTKYPDNQDKWINPSMNVAAPKVEQPTPVTVIPAVETTPVVVAAPETPQVVWKPVYIPLRADHQPIVFKSVNAHDYPIIDYSTGKQTIYMPPHHTVKAVDRFTDSKGSVYYRSESMAAEGLGYGIPKALLQEAVFDTALTRAERLAMKSASFVDKAYYAWLKAEKNMKFLDGIKSVFAGINQGKRK